MNLNENTGQKINQCIVKFGESKMTKNRFKYFLTLIVALPAVLIGASAMNVNNIKGMIVLLNSICLLIGWLISCFVIAQHAKDGKSKIHDLLIIILVLAMYVLTFIDPGVDGVHRWISIGPINLYISSIFAPLLIIKLWSLKKRNTAIWVEMLTVLVATLLFLQPDASQLTAFSIPLVLMLLNKPSKKILSYFVSGILIFLIITSWVRLDSLPAVVYVEEILRLVMDMGLIWSVFGVVSLIILPMPFLFLSKQSERMPSVCIGLYFAIILITTFFGNFPVPLMGYGISPIIGYLIAMTWLVKTKTIHLVGFTKFVELSE
jgi:cell division protein FtsW (lipid II flippase)